MNRSLDEMLRDPNPDHYRLDPLPEDLFNAGRHNGELKPCPFCGHTEILTHGRQNKASLIIGYEAVCANHICYATIQATGETQQQARKNVVIKWNNRG